MIIIIKKDKHFPLQVEDSFIYFHTEKLNSIQNLNPINLFLAALDKNLIQVFRKFLGIFTMWMNVEGVIPC